MSSVSVSLYDMRVDTGGPTSDDPKTFLPIDLWTQQDRIMINHEVDIRQLGNRISCSDAHGLYSS